MLFQRKATAAPRLHPLLAMPQPGTKPPPLPCPCRPAPLGRPLAPRSSRPPAGSPLAPRDRAHRVLRPLRAAAGLLRHPSGGFQGTRGQRDKGTGGQGDKGAAGPGTARGRGWGSTGCPRRSAGSPARLSPARLG